jgi:predicted Zn finger-like uncharacterized protein
MALVTRCSNPTCQTLFRVTPGQLQAFGGQVRCGSCATVFDAFPSLTTVADSALKVQGASPEPASMPEPADAEPSSDPAQAADAEPSSDPVQAADGDSSPLIDGERVTEWAPDPAQVVVDADAPLQPMAVDRVPDLRDAGSLDFVEPGPAESALAPVESIAPEAASPAPASPEQAIPRPSTPVSMASAAPGPAHAVPSGPAIDAVPRATPELTDYSVGAPAVKGRTTGGTLGRVLGIAIALLLAVLLAGQALYAYRTQIAAHYPASRPLLERLCRIAHCEVGLPKAADQLVIESSDLQAVDAAKPNLIQLAASVRNKAAIDVAFPAIEVTLTDAQDRPLARRVLLPDQYLAGGKPVGTGLRAGEHFSIRLTLDTTELRPVGYRLYLFYP